MEDGPGPLDGAVHVVGDHDDGDPFPVQVLDDPVQLRADHRVQPGDGLIQKEELPGGAQGPGQEHPLLLPAAEIPVAGVFQLRQPQLFQAFRSPAFFRTGIEGLCPAAGQDHLPHAGGEVLLGRGLLGQIPHLRLPEAVPVGDGPAFGLFQPQEGLDEGAFAGAVFPHDAEIVPGLHGKGQVLHRGLALVGQAQVPAGDERHISTAPPSAPPGSWPRGSDRSPRPGRRPGRRYGRTRG